MKYTTTIEIEAEQFIEGEKPPKGAVSNRGRPDDPRTKFFVYTKDGAQYLKDKEYVITSQTGTYVVSPEVFEKNYKPVESTSK